MNKTLRTFCLVTTMLAATGTQTTLASNSAFEQIVKPALVAAPNSFIKQTCTALVGATVLTTLNATIGTVAGSVLPTPMVTGLQKAYAEVLVSIMCAGTLYGAAKAVDAFGLAAQNKDQKPDAKDGKKDDKATAMFLGGCGVGALTLAVLTQAVKPALLAPSAA